MNKVKSEPRMVRGIYGRAKKKSFGLEKVFQLIFYHISVFMLDFQREISAIQLTHERCWALREEFNCVFKILVAFM